MAGTRGYIPSTPNGIVPTLIPDVPRPATNPETITK